MSIRKLAIGAVLSVGILSVPAKAPAQFDSNTIQTVAALLLAEKLGIDPQMITSLLGSGAVGGSLFDVAPVFAMQQQVPTQSAASILQLRNQGLGWDTIANKIGMQPAAYTRLKASGNLDNNNLWHNTVVNRLHVSDETVRNLRRMGFTWRDIVMTTVISRESNRPISEVAYRYVATKDWNRVANTFGVTRTKVTNRVTVWRQAKRVPPNWQRTIVWAPPGLAKKGGMPPGLAKKDSRAQKLWHKVDHKKKKKHDNHKGRGHH